MFEEYKAAFEKEEQIKKSQQSSRKLSEVVFRLQSFVSEKYQYFNTTNKPK